LLKNLIVNTLPPSVRSTPRNLIVAMLRASELAERVDTPQVSGVAKSLLVDADALFDQFFQGEGEENCVCDAYDAVGMVAMQLLLGSHCEA
jgi:hypothetical protein